MTAWMSISLALYLNIDLTLGPERDLRVLMDLFVPHPSVPILHISPFLLFNNFALFIEDGWPDLTGIQVVTPQV